MKYRGYKVDELWLDSYYRGRSCERYDVIYEIEVTKHICKEYNNAYYGEYIQNLRGKGVFLRGELQMKNDKF